MNQAENESIHRSVLLHEIVSAFAERLGAVPQGKPFWYLDGTLGGAGHASAIAGAYEQSTGSKLDVIGLDRDQLALDRAQVSLSGKAGRLILECADYRDLAAILDRHGIAFVDLILLDLGISSDELDHSGKGFSFLRDEPILMTMGDPATYPFTAHDIVNRWDEEDISNVIFGYGEERYARRIARAIALYRAKKPVETTTELAEIVRGSVPGMYRRGKIHPATRTFQALRIAVNDELGALRKGLTSGYARLAPQGMMAIISFHSLEDRIVKETFKAFAHDVGGLIHTKKPITPSAQEIAENPRSRSAKLRIIQKP